MSNTTFTEDQIKKLEAAILEVPAKFAIPLLQLINGFIQENTPKPEELDKHTPEGS